MSHPVQQSTLPHCPEQSMTDIIHIHYPPNIKNDTGRSTFKQELLKGQTETLFAYLFKSGEISHFIFYTERRVAWHKAIIDHHPSVAKKKKPTRSTGS